MRRCESCRWFRPVAAEGFNPEANAFSAKSGLIRWLVAQRKRVASAGWPGKCSEAPTPADVKSAYSCSRWDADDWYLESFNEKVFAHEESRQMEELRRALKDERNRSRARYRTLKEMRKQAPR